MQRVQSCIHYQALDCVGRPHGKDERRLNMRPQKPTNLATKTKQKAIASSKDKAAQKTKTREVVVSTYFVLRISYKRA